MSQIARLHTSTIANGQIINADDISDELNAQVNESNSQDTRITNLESGSVTISGNKNFSGSTTFSGAVSHTSTLGMTGAAAHILLASGTALASVTDAGIYVSSAGSPAGIRFNGTAWQFTNNGSTYTSLGSNYPVRYQASAPAVYATAATLTLAYLDCRDSTNAVNINKTTSTTVDITASGAGGLDTGAEASNTWYYLYAISKADETTSAILSVTNEFVSGTITLPTGYLYKRQLPFALRNDGSSNFLPWLVSIGGSRAPYIAFTNYTYNTAPYNSLAAGAATSFTAVTALAPAIANAVSLFFQCPVNINNATPVFHFRQTGSSGDMKISTTGGSNTSYQQINPIPFIGLNSSQQFDYFTSSATFTMNIDTTGFYVNGAI